MTTTLEAVFDGHVLLLEQPLSLAPNTRVRITIEAERVHLITTSGVLRDETA